jgi:hypothetical protein
MNRMRFVRLTMVSLSLSLLLFVGGCATTYSVEARNDTSGPVQLWLTKDGPPVEDGWRAPEDLATTPGESEPKYDFAIVEPGKTGYTPNMTGQFPKGTNPVLRVYGGTDNYFKLAEADKAGRARRSDYILKPGANKLVVRETLGRLVVEKE